MGDFTRFVTNKLSGEWSAGNVSGVLTDVIVEYLVSGEKWEGLDPLVRSRLLLAPLFMRQRDLQALRPALAKLAAAGAADKDEWVRAMAQSVGGFDGRLHTDRLLAGTKLVARTVEGLQPLLAAADPRLLRPLEEAYLNADLLQRLRGGQAAPPAAAKPHHHFRVRPASEAPSRRPQPGARGAPPLPRPAAPSAPSRPGRLAATDIDAMFMPRKPSLQRGSGGAAGAKVAAPPRRAATIDVGTVRSLNQQMAAEREKAAQAAREAAEAEARARAEARAAERAVKAAEREAEARRLAGVRAAEKAGAAQEEREAGKAAVGGGEGGEGGGAEAAAAAAAAKAAAREERLAAAAAKAALKEERAAARAAQKVEREAAAAAREAVRAATQGGRKRPAPVAGEGGEPAAKRGAQGGAKAGRAPVLLSPEETAAALGDAALAAAADSAGLRLDGPDAVRGVEAVQDFLTATYGQRYSSSDEEEPDV